MSAKPCSIPSNLIPTIKPEVQSQPKIKGPSFNNAFTQFLQKQSSGPSPNEDSKVKIKSPTTSPLKPTSIPTKVIVQSIKPTPPPLQLNKPPLTKVTPVQLRQEAWTNNILEQTQQQRVKTERIQPYVSGQTSIYTNQLQAENGKQLFCTVVTNPSTSSTFDKKQKLY